MRQLSLFTSKTSPAHRARRINRTRIDRHPNPGAGLGRDLWNQQNEDEQELALFFLDIRNFTPLTARYQAFDIVHIVKKLFSAFQNIIRVHRGRIIETAGDGFYAAFGFDTDISQAVDHSVRAGMAILKTLEDLNERSFEPRLGQPIEVGIGIHAGKVATGNLHLGSKEHLVVMGYSVNIAARIQAMTKDLNNNFIVSSAVYELLGNNVTSRGPVSCQLKGVSEQVDLFPIGKNYNGALSLV